MSEFRFWNSVGKAASREAADSPLPGYFDGPADASRHIVGTAELRRRFDAPRLPGGEAETSDCH